MRVDLSRRALQNRELEERLAEPCRREIRIVAEAFNGTNGEPAVMALALIAASHGLGSTQCYAAADLEALCAAAASFIADRVAEG